MHLEGHMQVCHHAGHYSVLLSKKDTCNMLYGTQRNQKHSYNLMPCRILSKHSPQQPRR